MRLRLAFTLFAFTCLASAGSISIEKPLTLGRVDSWMTYYMSDGTQRGGLFPMDSMPDLALFGEFSITNYYSQLPTDVTYTGASISVRFTSDTITYSGGSDGLVRFTIAPVSDFQGGTYLFAGPVPTLGGEGNCPGDPNIYGGRRFRYDGMAGGSTDLTECLSYLLQPTSRVLSFSPFQAALHRFHVVDFEVIDPAHFPPPYPCPEGEVCGPYSAYMTVTEKVTGTVSLTFTYDDPSEVPEPSTWALAGGALCALPVVRRWRS